MIKHMTIKGKPVDDGEVFFATPRSACFDIKSTETVVIAPGEVKAISTGLFVEIVPGNESYDNAITELMIRSRSGLASKGIIVVNSPGCVDEDFPNEIKVLLANFSSDEFTVTVGDRIAQGAFNILYRPGNILIKQDARVGGFGSTGVK